MTWIQAAVWAHHTPENFFVKSGDYQSQIVAAYLIDRREEAVIAKAQADEAHRQQGK